MLSVPCDHYVTLCSVDGLVPFAIYLKYPLRDAMIPAPCAHQSTYAYHAPIAIQYLQWTSKSPLARFITSSYDISRCLVQPHLSLNGIRFDWERIYLCAVGRAKTVW